MMRVIAISLTMVLAACNCETAVVEISGETMGTTYNIVAVDPSAALDSAEVKAAVEATLADVNAKMSNWDPSSEVSRFNAAQSTEAVAISEDFAAVMAAANQVHAQSSGQFDVTLGPLIEIWGFGARTPESPVPSDAAIAQALGVVGQAKMLTLGEGTLAKARPDTQIYLAAIAKGYGVDRVAATLRDQGMSDYMVEIGGDLVTSGTNPEGKAWKIGIERPDAAAGTIEEVVAISGLGMATSGDYRNYFEAEGQRYSHIIDAQTGRPITHGTASVTVLAESAMLADAWATALLALGLERGMTISDDLNLAVMFIVRDSSQGEMRFTTHGNARFNALQAQ